MSHVQLIKRASRFKVQLLRDQRHIRSMPTIDLDDDELGAVADAVRNSIGRYRHAPRLAPLKSALAKLDPASAPTPPIERPRKPMAPARTRGGSVPGDDQLLMPLAPAYEAL